MSSAQRWLSAITVCVVLVGGARDAAGQAYTIVDLPPNTATVTQPFTIAGWAIDSASPDTTGVDIIHVYAYPYSGQPQVFLGAAAYGGGRPDVGAACGQRFTNSGYGLTALGLPAGAYIIVVYAHSTVSGGWNSAVTGVTVIGTDPRMNIDAPLAGQSLKQPFLLGGWAIDLAAGTGSGVDVVQVYAYANGDLSAPPIYVGTAAYGGYRGDVAAAYGERFGYSAFGVTVSGLPSGTYGLVAFMRSVVTGGFTYSKMVVVDVDRGRPRMSIDAPASPDVTQPFLVGGWAIDLDAATGTGVDVLHVYAYPSSGAAPIFLGMPAYGGARGDVAAYYGSQFTASGYNLEVAAGTLSPGPYHLVVYSHSTVTGTFNLAMGVNIVVDQKVTTPAVSLPGGVYSEPISVALSSPTATSIRYTTDGSDPGPASPLYVGPVYLDGPVTLRARGFRDGWIASDAVAAGYAFEAVAPSFAPVGGTYEGPIQVTASTPTAQSVVRFTLDGSDPTDASAPYFSAIPLSPSATYTLKARTFRAGWTPSPTSTATYVVTVRTLAAPVSTPPEGVYAENQLITLSCPDSFATIRYTVDGSDPTEASLIAIGSLTLSNPLTVRARAFYPGYTASPVMTATYTPRVATPQLSPPGGYYDSPPSVSASTTTSDVTLRYTLDGSDPSESSPSLLGSIYVPLPSAFTVRGWKAGWAASEPVSEVYTSGTIGPGSPAVVTPSSAAAAYVPVGAPATFDISGASLLGPDEVTVYRGAAQLPVSVLSCCSFSVGGLVDGRNELDIYAVDNNGIGFEEHAVVWAGSRSLTVFVRDTRGQAVNGAAVTASLVDDGDVRVTLTTAFGAGVTFNALPTGANVTVAVAAANFREQEVLVSPTQAQLTVILDDDNNEFALGLTGWPYNGMGTAVSVEHSEYPRGWVDCFDCAPRESAVLAATGDTTSALAATTDMDLILTNKNVWPFQPPATITRRFTVSTGTQQVTLRYRFASFEMMVPGPRADAFDVVLRNLTTGVRQEDHQNVFTLISSGSFIGQGATAWRTLTLPVSDAQEVQLDLSVANAFDNAYMSIIEADLVQERGVSVASFQLHDYAPPGRVLERLEFLSLSAHTSYAGNTRINGTFCVTGAPEDSLQLVELQIIENGQVKVAVPLRRSPDINVLGVAFGTTGVSVPTSVLVFEMPSAGLNPVFDQAYDGDVSLRLRVRTALGFENPAANGFLTRKVQKLVNYPATNRYGRPPENLARDLDTCRDTTHPCGGDGWTLPKNSGRAQQMTGVRFNDFSNMNGGIFPLHSSHRHGDDVDVNWTAGDFAPRARDAQELIRLLNSPVGASIDFIYVTYSPVATDAFWREIRTAHLSNYNNEPIVPASLGPNPTAAQLFRHARIRPYQRHVDHFHIHFRP